MYSYKAHQGSMLGHLALLKGGHKDIKYAVVLQCVYILQSALQFDLKITHVVKYGYI